MIKAALIGAIAAAAFTLPAVAGVITPVDVTASSTFVNYDKDSLIDGSGLVGDLHDATYSNMWMTDLGVDTAKLTFDLGALYDLSAIKVWNYNFGREEYASTLDRAAKVFTLSVSADGLTYDQVLSGEFARGTGELLAAETLGFSGLGRYVQLDLYRNHEAPPGAYGYAPVGLSEVRFFGSAVPEPATWAMMITGFALAGSALRRRRVAVA